MSQESIEMSAEHANHKWIELFDGESLNGWQALMHPEVWSVRDGMIVGSNAQYPSLLFYKDEMPVVGRPAQRFRNLEFMADIKLSHGGISSMYFRSEFVVGAEVGVAPGYIAQANNTADNEQRTGSLYSLAPFTEQLVADDTWWTQHVIANGDHVRILVNGIETVNFVDWNHTYEDGYLALLMLLPNSVVHFRNLRARGLPDYVHPVEPSPKAKAAQGSLA